MKVCIELSVPDNEGEGDLVGDVHTTGEGEGVLAKGDSGIWPTDFLLLGECRDLVLTFLRPCRDDGRFDKELK